MKTDYPVDLVKQFATSPSIRNAFTHQPPCIQASIATIISNIKVRN